MIRSFIIASMLILSCSRADTKKNCRLCCNSSYSKETKVGKCDYYCAFYISKLIRYCTCFNSCKYSKCSNCPKCCKYDTFSKEVESSSSNLLSGGDTIQLEILENDEIAKATAESREEENPSTSESSIDQDVNQIR